MATVLLLGLVLSLQILAASAARDLPLLSSSSSTPTFLPRFVLGYAICDSCWEMALTANSMPLPNVTAAVECFDAGGRIIYRQTSSTDKTGAFSLELPLQIADSVSMLSTCTCRVVRGPLNHRCTYPLAQSYNSFLSPRSLPDGRQIYGVGPFIFRPRAKFPECDGDQRQQQQPLPQLVSRAVSLQPQTPTNPSSISSSVFQSPTSIATPSSTLSIPSSTPSSAWSASNSGAGALQVNLSLQVSTSSSSPSPCTNSSPTSCPSSSSPGLPTFPFPLFPFPTIPTSTPYQTVPTAPFPTIPIIPFPPIPIPTIPIPQAPAASPSPSPSSSPLTFTPPSPAPYPTPSVALP